MPLYIDVHNLGDGVTLDTDARARHVLERLAVNILTGGGVVDNAESGPQTTATHGAGISVMRLLGPKIAWGCDGCAIMADAESGRDDGAARSGASVAPERDECGRDAVSQSG